MNKKLRIRTVLFDIDGTLLDTHGLGREAFIRGLAQVTGVRDELEYVSFAGNTDRRVLAQVMARRKRRPGEPEVRRIFARVAAELRDLLRERPGEEIPGARRFVQQLARAGAALGLVTGNIRACAYLKLGSVALEGFFGFGGFGDVHAARSRIARAALAAARAAGADPQPGTVCLIGDTPFDVAAGRAAGIPVVGVATGRYRPDDLRAAGAVRVVADFSDPADLMAWLAEPSGSDD